MLHKCKPAFSAEMLRNSSFLTFIEIFNRLYVEKETPKAQVGLET